MPVDIKPQQQEVLYQRAQYEKGGIGRLYWDYRDKSIFENIQRNAQVILDAGCGEGITLEELCKRFPNRDVRGIDINPENIDICKKYNLPVSEGDLLNIDVSDESVDCCVFSEVVEHLNQYNAALTEIYRVLKKGGRLIIVFPNDFMFKLARILCFKFKEAFYDPGHVRQWAPRMMKKHLKKMGFKIIRTKNIPFLFWPISLHCVITADKKEVELR